MVAARDADFLGDGTVDPFTGLAPMSVADQQKLEDARRARLRQSAANTANINLKDQPGQTLPDGAHASSSNWDPNFNRFELNDPHNKFSAILGRGLETVKEHPWLPLLPAAPIALAAAAPAAAGEGTLVGASNAGPGLAFADADTAAAEAAVNGARIPVAGAASAATTPTLGGMVAKDVGAAALPVAAAVGPYAISKLAGGTTKEESALIAKQQQMAQEAKVRQGQQQDARMNMLGQQMLAFNPRNQMLAQMFGPQAAFTPDAMAQMAQGPAPAYDEKWNNYQGTDPKTQADIVEYIRRKKEYDAAESARHSMIMGGVQQPGPGPAPIQMSAPQAARKY